MIEKIKAELTYLQGFSFSLLAAFIAFGVMASIAIPDESFSANHFLLILLSAHLFFSFFMVEYSLSRFKYWALMAVALIDVILYLLLTYVNNTFFSAQVFLVLISVVLIGNVRPGSDSKVWFWQNYLIKSVLEAVVVAILFVASAGSIIFLVNFVFDVATPTPIIEGVVKFALTIVAAVVFILRIKVERDLQNHFILSVLTFLIVPLWLIYSVLLNIYALRMLLMWSLPKGMVVLPITLSFIIMILCWWGLNEVKTFWPQRLLRIALFLHIPLLILFALAMGRRIYDYGWTPHRSLLVVYWCFFAEILYLLLTKKLSARKLAITLWVSQILAFVPV